MNNAVEYGVFVVECPNPKPEVPVTTAEVSASTPGVICLIAAAAAGNN